MATPVTTPIDYDGLVPINDVVLPTISSTGRRSGRQTRRRSPVRTNQRSSVMLPTSTTIEGSSLLTTSSIIRPRSGPSSVNSLVTNMGTSPAMLPDLPTMTPASISSSRSGIERVMSMGTSPTDSIPLLPTVDSGPSETTVTVIPSPTRSLSTIGSGPSRSPLLPTAEDIEGPPVLPVGITEMIPTVPLLESREAATKTNRLLSESPKIYLNTPAFETVFGKASEILGRGTYGVVYRTYKNFAIKELLSPEECANGIDSSTVKEIAILKHLDHQNVLPIYGINIDINNCKFQFAMPVARGSLDNSIKRRLNLTERKMAMYQMLRGLAYCHAQFVWHLDLKPGNILEFKHGEYKLADFGISEIYAVNGKPHSIDVVTLWYRAPEILLGNAYYTETADVWSMGAILAEMMTGRPLFPGNSEIDELYRIFRLLGTPTNKHWSGVESLPEYNTNFPRWPNNFNSNFVNEDPEEVAFLREMLTWPNDRKKAIDLLDHSYFDGIRILIDAEFPIIELDCGELMLQQQVSIPKPKSKLLTDPNYRYIGFEWLWEVSNQFSLKSRTLFLAYLFYDAYVSTSNISRFEVQLLLLASLSLASKMNDVYYIEISDLNNMSDSTYTNVQIIDMEIKLLSTLNFNIIFPSCGNFSDYMISNKTPRNIQKFMYSIMAVIMTNSSWPFKLNQHEVAQSGIELALQVYRSTGTRCLRRLKGGRSLSIEELSNYLLNLKPSALSKQVISEIEKSRA